MDRELRWGIALCAAVVLLAAARGVAEPGPQLLGYHGAEVYGHAWVQWWASEAWPRLPRETVLIAGRGPIAWPVIDPAVTWLAAGLGRVLGAVTAYDLLVLLGVIGAFWGGWALAARVGGLRITGALVLALAPIFAGSLASGLTEDFGLGVVAFALAQVGRPGLRRALGAGLLLGSLAWLGLYLALMGAIGALILGIGTLFRAPARIRELLVAAAVAAALVLPVAWWQGERLEGTGHRGGEVAERPEPQWRLNPSRGADLASFVTPGPVAVEEDVLVRMHPAYLGLAVLVLAVAAGRRGGAWWAVLLVALLLAPGPVLRVAGASTGVANPFVTLARDVPLLSLVNHWGRMVLLAAVALAPLAALGARRLSERDPRLGRGLTGLVVAELLFLSPAPWPLPITDAAIPAVHGSLDPLPPGAVIVVPSAGPGVPFQRPLYRQRAHGRPLVAHPNRPGYGRAENVPLVRWFASLPGERHDPPDPMVDFSRRQLVELGVGVILVEDSYVEDVRALLGEPDVHTEGGAAWSVAGLARGDER